MDHLISKKKYMYCICFVQIFIFFIVSILLVWQMYNDIVEKKDKIIKQNNNVVLFDDKKNFLGFC